MKPIMVNARVFDSSGVLIRAPESPRRSFFLSIGCLNCTTGLVTIRGAKRGVSPVDDYIRFSGCRCDICSASYTIDIPRKDVEDE